VAQRTPRRPSVGGADGPAQARGARPNDLIEICGASKRVVPARVLAGAHAPAERGHAHGTRPITEPPQNIITHRVASA